MPKHQDIKKILVIGSGPIVIGQAAEFDYAGTQACLALKEEGCKVILINNNPATVMTDKACADVVYFEPLTVESVEKIIQKERPDGILATLGGQTGLNLALSLHKEGVLEKYGVPLLGTPIESIMKGEDREEFRALMHQLEEPVPESEIVETVEGALQFANQVGYPIIVRPAYTLGGAGGGIVNDEQSLKKVVKGGLNASPINQCLIEKSIAGFKEVEYEVMRDANDTCITVCNMENIDPVGIHTGDSIVVAPSQTLTDVEYQMLRSVSVKIIRALGIVGGCNIQFALDPYSKNYYLIEVNPRVSRSSALASKATGYPIARIAAKLSIGYHLHELLNPVTGHTYASFEPALDYCVVKFPRWPFDKFPQVDRKLGTQMKATGEVMAIERNLESAFQKAIRSLDIKGISGLEMESVKKLTDEKLWKSVKVADDLRFFAILELLRRGFSEVDIHEVTQINYFYLKSWKFLIEMEQKAKQLSYETVTNKELEQFKVSGFSDKWLATTWKVSLHDMRKKRNEFNIHPSYKMVDTCAGEFVAKTAYYYSSWSGEQDVDTASTKKKIIIIGSGPIRIGQGIEFDYVSVHGVLALKQEGYEAILINNNPETVSTDYEIADRLYFEPLTTEDVLNIIELETADGVIVQLGGQTAISLVKELEDAGVPLLGTNHDTIDKLEDRDLFYQFMNEVHVPHIPGVTAINEVDLITKADEIGYPVLIRPSYVIGGQGMMIFQSREEMVNYVNDEFTNVFFPILLDAYYPGVEVEVDALTDGVDIVIPGMFQHIEKAGVHSGDSISVIPPLNLAENHKETIVEYTKRIANGMEFKGVFNIQFVLYKEEIFVLEVNPRASRTVPILSKVTGMNMIDVTTKLLMGHKLTDLVDTLGYQEEPPYYTVKAPVFSHSKLPDLDPKLEAEMKSTGELISISDNIDEAFRKAFVWGERDIPQIFKKKGSIYCEIGKDVETEFLLLKEQLEERDYVVLQKDDVSFQNWLNDENSVCFLSVNVNDQDAKWRRKEALKNRLPVVTEVSTFTCIVNCLNTNDYSVSSINQWLEMYESKKGETKKLKTNY
ncbi:carbamoyl phosphate synthase large subunit [Anaerobacillus alkalidiazotrophicus]|uniref:Carbamoyl phosphate synthase large chain n=1 Tax=Anaerobacillus alkalidiazotrophicus TaxID=472963 RepID=A0A1S2M642_9BACI|nr:carbamoyl phosphate synthase large subunit [Anaerobacillus alkalidiazotrophicus]OIJ18464.1 carbamoyl phosphate synthase large subunit [Anaerobacillus alkalidiazotrophicus]OIJ19943.1 carbamoyl phosphate synthase large subunit [Anaerobacillus alkalidiazotrophicus]